MAAKVIKQFDGVRDGDTQVSTIKVGDVIHGELAKVALAQKWAEEVADAGSVSQEDLAKMSVSELKAHAAERGIDLAGATKKAEILAAIKAAQG